MLFTFDPGRMSARVPNIVIMTHLVIKKLVSFSNQQCQVCEFVGHAIQTTAAGLSQSLIISVSNDTSTSYFESGLHENELHIVSIHIMKSSWQ